MQRAVEAYDLERAIGRRARVEGARVVALSVARLRVEGKDIRGSESNCEQDSREM